jgi:hypothetical protein
MGVSPSLYRGSVVEKLLSLRPDFCSYNQARGSRTAIWYSSGWFLQWHEGPLAAVEEAWRTSQRYRWQGTHALLHRSQGPHGLVDPLHLSTVHSRETQADVARRIHSVGRQHELGWSAEPAEIWRQLTAPCLLAGADAMASVARENVVAVTSEYGESVDLVRAIAEQHRSDLVYQRFADGGLAGVDAGAAYVDVAHGTRTTRVQALSRRALENSMVRLSLQQTQCVVLLLGSRPSAAARLAMSVVDLLAGMDVWPAVRLVGACAETCEAAAQVLSQLHGVDLGRCLADAGGRAPVQAVLQVVGQLRRDAAFVASGVADLS